MKIAKEYRWEMGHRLSFHDGKCVNFHGHSYKARITLEGERDENGLLVDFYDLDKIVGPLVESLDHSFALNAADEKASAAGRDAGTQDDDVRGRNDGGESIGVAGANDTRRGIARQYQGDRRTRVRNRGRLRRTLGDVASYDSRLPASDSTIASSSLMRRSYSGSLRKCASNFSVVRNSLAGMPK